MLKVSLREVEGFLSEALGWSGLKCKVNALFQRYDHSVIVVAYIPGHGEKLVHLIRVIADSFCDDVELNELDCEGAQYRTVFVLKPDFVLKPETLTDEAG
jgi:hypothetical protein